MDQYEVNMQQRKYHDMEPISEIDHILKNEQSLRNSVHVNCILCNQRGVSIKLVAFIKNINSVFSSVQCVCLCGSPQPLSCVLHRTHVGLRGRVTGARTAISSRKQRCEHTCP